MEISITESGDRMEPLNMAAPSISSRLSEPLSSTSQLLDILVPPLASLDLLTDLPPSFVSRYRPSSAPIDPSRFAKRQLGLVQKVLIEKVWPDWEKAVEAEEGSQGLLVFERWFIPPSTSSSNSKVAAKVALSSYSILASMLSAKSASNLQLRSLEIISSLLVKLNAAFNLSELYVTTLGASKAPAIQDSDSDEEEEEDERIDPTSSAEWEQSLKDIVGVPVRIANAYGIVAEKRGLRAGTNLPTELDLEIYNSSLTSSYFSLIWSLSSTTSDVPVFPSALSVPLKALLPSPAFLSTALPLLIPRILPPATFPTPAEELMQRQKHIVLVRKVVAELPDRDLSRLLREVLSKLARDLKTTPNNDTSISAKATSFVLSTLFGPLEPSSSIWKVAVEVLLDRNCTWDAEFVPKAVLGWLDGKEKAIVSLLDKVKEVWGSLEEMKSGYETRRTYLTSLLLVLIASLPPMHSSIVSLSRSPLFLSAVSSSLHTISPLSRLLGMLVAEYVSNRSVDPQSGVQPLDFGSSIWDGEGAEKNKIRDLRELFDDVEKGLKIDGWKELLGKVYSQDSTSPSATIRKPQPRQINKPIQPTEVEEPAEAPTKRPLISIIGSDDEDDEDLKPYPLPPAPSEATLEALSSSDPSLYQSAYSTPSTNPSQSRRRGKLRAPVYIFELTEYLRGKDPDGGSQKKEEADQEAERVEMALKEGEGLIRRKAGWGNELRENAVNLAIALMSLQDNYELDNFEQAKQNMLVALIVGCPVEVSPCVIEQYFMPTYSISQLHTFLTSLALAARELAQLPIPSLPSSTSAKPREPLFPSKQLPPALHRRLLGSRPDDQLQVLAADLTNLALSDAREDAETTLPGAAREKLLSVRRFNSKSSSLSKPTNVPSTPSYTTLCAEYFILPLLNRFWLYLRDTATSAIYAPPSSKGSYAGGPSSTPILQPLLLSNFLTTVSILLHAARHAPTFLAVLAPEALALVSSLRPPTSSPNSMPSRDDDPSFADQDLVLSAEMELILLILSSSHSLDGGQTLTRSSFEILSEVQSWAEEVFEMEESKSGGAAVGRAGRAAAGVLLRLEEILGRWRGRVGWE